MEQDITKTVNVFPFQPIVDATDSLFDVVIINVFYGIKV